MATEYKTYKINDFIRKTPKGELDIDMSIKLVREVATAIEVHLNYNLLIDLRQTEPIKNFVDLLTIATEFAKYKSTFRNKIAFIIPNDPRRIERAQFFLQSLNKESFKIKYFTEYEEAIEWLSIVKKYPERNT